MKRVILFIMVAASVLFFNGCKDDEECPSCLNGGECVDGSCNCPPGFTGDDCGQAVDLKVTRVTVNSIPFTNPATGNDWDESDVNPDVYFVFRDDNGNDIYAYPNPKDNVDSPDLPVEFSLSSPFSISDLNLKLTVAFYDSDNGEDLLDFDDDFIGAVEFDISDYTSGSDAYPTSINMQEQDLDITLNLQWLP